MKLYIILRILAIGTTAHLVVELAVDWCPITIDQLKGVRAIAIHVPKTIWDATVTEQEGHLVGGLWAETEEVPEHVRILYRVGGWDFSKSKSLISSLTETLRSNM